MNKLVSIVFAAGLALLTTGAQAMPLAAIDASNGAVIIQVAQGCGPGGHRGPFGHCRPLYDCPPGWHTGPYGVDYRKVSVFRASESRSGSLRSTPGGPECCLRAPAGYFWLS
jgi:hypothetical protein